MPDVLEIVIPLPSKPQHLKMVFNNSAFMLIEEKTGKDPFTLMETPNELKKTKNLVAVLFAGTRRHHTRNPGVSEEQLLEWLDELDPQQVLEVYGQIMKVFFASFLPRAKREGFLKEVSAKQKTATEELEKVSEPPKTNPSPPPSDGKAT